MSDLFIYTMISGFLISLPPGIVNIIAFERTLNHSFKAGWAIAIGATLAHGVFAALPAFGIVVIGDSEFMQAMLEFVQDNILKLLTLIGIFMFISGVIFLRKEHSEPKEYAITGITLGLLLTLANIGNLATHTAAITLESQATLTFIQASIVVLAVVIGAHIGWLSKLGLVVLFKKQLIRWNVTNFNRVFGWIIIALSTTLLTITTFIAFT